MLGVQYISLFPDYVIRIFNYSITIYGEHDRTNLLNSEHLRDDVIFRAELMWLEYSYQHLIRFSL